MCDTTSFYSWRQQRQPVCRKDDNKICQIKYLFQLNEYSIRWKNKRDGACLNDILIMKIKKEEKCHRANRNNAFNNVKRIHRQFYLCVTVKTHYREMKKYQLFIVFLSSFIFVSQITMNDFDQNFVQWKRIDAQVNFELFSVFSFENCKKWFL